MKTFLIGAMFSLAASAAGAQAASAQPVVTAPAPAPMLMRVWWAGPNTVCHHGYYGSYCHSAYARPWVPGHYSWRGFWIPGHWV